MSPAKRPGRPDVDGRTVLAPRVFSLSRSVCRPPRLQTLRDHENCSAVRPLAAGPRTTGRICFAGAAKSFAVICGPDQTSGLRAMTHGQPLPDRQVAVGSARRAAATDRQTAEGPAPRPLQTGRSQEPPRRAAALDRGKSAISPRPHGPVATAYDPPCRRGPRCQTPIALPAGSRVIATQRSPSG
jgi:hypothetical protein